jgi:hypothetical protein
MHVSREQSSSPVSAALHSIPLFTSSEGPIGRIDSLFVAIGQAAV